MLLFTSYKHCTDSREPSSQLWVCCLNVLVVSASSSGLLGGASSSNATRSVTLNIRRVDSKINVLLRVSADQEGRNVDQLLADADVALANEDTGMVDRLGKVELEYLSLKSAFHEDLGGELEDIIERVLILGHDTVALKSADKRRSLEKSLRILSI
jgi:hypothetical protein